VVPRAGVELFLRDALADGPVAFGEGLGDASVPRPQRRLEGRAKLTIP